MPKEKEDRDAELLATRIGGLLDFYSDRAVAHASFFVASIFGLITLLSIIGQLDTGLKWFSIPLFWWSIPLFFAFSYVGYYTLGRFSYYADISQRLSAGYYADISRKLGEYGLRPEETLQGVPYKPKNKPKKTLKDYIDKQEELQKNLFILKKIIAKGRGKSYLALLYWVLILYLGSIVYSTFWHSGIEWFGWFGFLGIMIIFFVFIPWLCYRKSKENKE